MIFLQTNAAQRISPTKNAPNVRMKIVHQSTGGISVRHNEMLRLGYCLGQFPFR